MDGNNVESREGYTSHSRSKTSPNWAPLWYVTLRFVVLPVINQNPGFAIVSMAHAVQMSWNAACAPPARFWNCWRYSCWTGNRKTSLPVDLLVRFASSSSSCANQARVYWRSGIWWMHNQLLLLWLIAGQVYGVRHTVFRQSPSQRCFRRLRSSFLSTSSFDPGEPSDFDMVFRLPELADGAFLRA